MTEARELYRRNLREQLRAGLSSAERIELLADEVGDYALSKDAKRASAAYLEALLRLIGVDREGVTKIAKRRKK